MSILLSGEKSNPVVRTQRTDSWELRCRFLVALAWILGIGTMRHPVLIGVSGAILLGMLFHAVIPLKRILRNLLITFPFLLISFLTLSISDGFPVTKNAVEFALLISFRMTACVLAVGLVTGNDVRDYLNAFRAMKFPSTLIAVLFLTQRYVHVVGRQFSSTWKALVSRLFSPRFRMKTFRIYGQIVGGMTIHAIDRSEHVRKAMESRGFHGKLRTDQAAPIRWTDVLKSVSALLPLLAILFMERCFLS